MTLAVVLYSCSGSGSKENNTADDSKSKQNAIEENNSKESVPGSFLGTDTATFKKKLGEPKDDILKKIDDYLVSKASFSAPENGIEGISNATVTIENTLPDISFQKAMVEVSILLADGTEYRTDYHTVINLDPGTAKVVKIPTTTRGVSIHAHIIKIKSKELTNNEWVYTGNQYVPKAE